MNKLPHILPLALLLLGLWRCWVGGGIGKDWPIKSGLTWLQYAIGAGIIIAGCWYQPWPITVTNVIGLLLLERWAPHGAMLTYPLAMSPAYTAERAKKDWVLTAARWFGGRDALQWVTYAIIRYYLPAGLWSALLALEGFGTAERFAPLIGYTAICVLYLVTYKLYRFIPVFTTPGDQAANLTELVGRTILGGLLAWVVMP